MSSTSGVTEPALAGMHQLVWAKYAHLFLILCSISSRWGGSLKSDMRGISPWNLQMLLARAVFFFLLESRLLNIYQQSIGFSFSLIMNADTSVCWSYLLSLKNGSPDILGSPSLHGTILGTRIQRLIERWMFLSSQYFVSNQKECFLQRLKSYNNLKNYFMYSLILGIAGWVMFLLCWLSIKIAHHRWHSRYCF